MNYIGNSKSLMKAYNVVYTCTLKIGELTYSYVGKVGVLEKLIAYTSNSSTGW